MEKALGFVGSSSRNNDGSWNSRIDQMADRLKPMKNHNRTLLSKPTNPCRHLLHQRPSAALLSPPLGGEPTSSSSGVHPLPGRPLPLRWLTSCYDSFSKGTITTRDHIYVASATLRLINSEPCMAGGVTRLAGRHPRPFLTLSPASGGCALQEKAKKKRSCSQKIGA